MRKEMKQLQRRFFFFVVVVILPCLFGTSETQNQVTPSAKIPENCWLDGQTIHCSTTHSSSDYTVAENATLRKRQSRSSFDLFNAARSLATVSDQPAIVGTNAVGSIKLREYLQSSLGLRFKHGDAASAKDIITSQGSQNAAAVQALLLSVNSARSGGSALNGLTASAGALTNPSTMAMMPITALDDLDGTASSWLQRVGLTQLGACADPNNSVFKGTELYTTEQCAGTIATFLAASNRNCFTVIYSPASSAGNSCAIAGFQRLLVNGVPTDCYRDIFGGCRVSMTLLWQSQGQTLAPPVTGISSNDAKTFTPIQLRPLTAPLLLFSADPTQPSQQQTSVFVGSLPLADIGYVESIALQLGGTLNDIKFDWLAVVFTIDGAAFGLDDRVRLWTDWFAAVGAPAGTALLQQSVMTIPLLPVARGLDLLLTQYIEVTGSASALSLPLPPPPNSRFCPSAPVGSRRQLLATDSAVINLQTTIYAWLMYRFASTVLRQLPSLDLKSIGCFDPAELIKLSNLGGAAAVQQATACALDPIGAVDAATGSSGSCPGPSMSQTRAVTVYRYMIVLRDWQKRTDSDVQTIDDACREMLEEDRRAYRLINPGPYTADREEQFQMLHARIIFCTLTEADALMLQSQFPHLIQSLERIFEMEKDDNPILEGPQGDWESLSSKPFYCPFNIPAFGAGKDLRRRAPGGPTANINARIVFEDLDNVRSLSADGNGVHIHAVELELPNQDCKACCHKFLPHLVGDWTQTEKTFGKYHHAVATTCMACSIALQAEMHLYNSPGSDSERILRGLNPALNNIYAMPEKSWHIINLSTAIRSEASITETARQNLKNGYRNIGNFLNSRQVFMVKAAGNRGEAVNIHDAMVDNAQTIFVGGTLKNLETNIHEFWCGEKASSNYGNRLTLLAAVDGTVLVEQKGTSFSAPRVAGVLAMILSQLELDRYPDKIKLMKQTIYLALAARFIDDRKTSAVRSEHYDFITRSDVQLPTKCPGMATRPSNWFAESKRARLSVSSERLLNLIEQLKARMQLMSTQ